MSLNAALLQALADEGLDLSAAIRVAARLEAFEAAEQAAKIEGKRAGNAERQRRFKARRKAQGNADNAGNALPPSPNDIYSNPQPAVSSETEARGACAKPGDVSDHIWSNWLKHRKAKKAKITELAMAGIRREAEKAGWTMEAALTKAMERNWVGFEAEWVTSNRAQPPPAQQTDYQRIAEEARRRRQATA